jgi:hypothetical protein
MKICFPAVEDLEWKILTGCDPKKRALVVPQRRQLARLLWTLAAVAQQNRQTRTRLASDRNG